MLSTVRALPLLIAAASIGTVNSQTFDEFLKEKRKYGAMAEAAETAYFCASLASRATYLQESNRLNKIGDKLYKNVLTALDEKKASMADMPLSFQFSLLGRVESNHDFTMGRLYQAESTKSFNYVKNQIQKDGLEFSLEALDTYSKTEFDVMSCSKISENKI